MVRLVAATMVVLVLMLVLTLVRALALGAKRAGLPAARLAGGAAVAIGGWLTVTAVLAHAGVFSAFGARPPRVLFAPLSAAAILFAVARTPTFGRLLVAVPKHWPIALQTMRIPIELGLWSLFLAGRIPVQMTFEGRNFDVLVGVSAPLVALLVARGRISTRWAIAWNLAGLGLLAHIVGIAVTSVPGPLHLDWPGVPATIVTEVPFVWLPAFLVPTALFGHVLSLRQLFASSGQPASAPSWAQGREAR